MMSNMVIMVAPGRAASIVPMLGMRRIFGLLLIMLGLLLAQMDGMLGLLLVRMDGMLGLLLVRMDGMLGLLLVRMDGMLGLLLMRMDGMLGLLPARMGGMLGLLPARMGGMLGRLPVRMDGVLGLLLVRMDGMLGLLPTRMDVMLGLLPTRMLGLFLVQMDGMLGLLPTSMEILHYEIFQSHPIRKLPIARIHHKNARGRTHSCTTHAKFFVHRSLGLGGKSSNLILIMNLNVFFVACLLKAVLNHPIGNVVLLQKTYVLRVALSGVTIFDAYNCSMVPRKTMVLGIRDGLVFCVRCRQIPNMRIGNSRERILCRIHVGFFSNSFMGPTSLTLFDIAHSIDECSSVNPRTAQHCQIHSIFW